MDELTTIGDYQVRAIDRAGPIVRYAATHVVLPRQAIIELIDADAPKLVAVKLMRRACILEALHERGVPRVFECGRLDGRPWIAIEHDAGVTLHDELQHYRLQVSDILTLLESVASVLSHAHARGVLHGDITAKAILRQPSLVLTRWENACVHDSELVCDAIDGREDVFALGKMALEALAERHTIPVALATLLVRMLARDLAGRPTATEVVDAVHAIRDSLGGPSEAEALEHDVEVALASLIDETQAEEPLEIMIDYAGSDDGDAGEAACDLVEDDDEPILLDRPISGQLQVALLDRPMTGHVQSVEVHIEDFS